MSPHPRMTADDLTTRTIRFGDWVSCKAAFIDCRMPGSELKDNYSFVGPGVTQNADQVVNLRIPHGFQLGAAGMPHAVTNNLHLHFTAEVFVNLSGRYLLRWGPDGQQGTYETTDGDVISVPTWVFRGFTNIGPDDGILFTVLGGDDTGGIIWSPDVLAQAAGHGLHLTRANTLVDTSAGQILPPPEQLVRPLTTDELDALDTVDVEQFRSRVVTPADRTWSTAPFLCSDLPGGGAELALVIGYGLTEDRHQTPPLHDPHGFAVSWLGATAGQGVLTHSLQVPQTLTVTAGSWRVRVNGTDDALEVTLQERDTLSVPPGVWRHLECVDTGSGERAELLVVTAGDERARIAWHPDVVSAASRANTVIDANGYRAPAAVLSTIASAP